MYNDMDHNYGIQNSSLPGNSFELHLFIPLSPEPLTTADLSTVFGVLAFPECHIVGII